MRIRYPDLNVCFLGRESGPRTALLVHCLNRVGYNSLRRFEPHPLVRELPDGALPNGKLPNPRWAAIAQNELEMARAAVLPALLMEDDAALTPWADPEAGIEVPDDADGIYAGASKLGFDPDSQWYTRSCAVSYPSTRAEAERYSGLMRVRNMLGTHAIILLTERFRQAMIAAYNRALDGSTSIDWEMAKILKDYRVWMPKKPHWYQHCVRGMASTLVNWI